jgi:hypothetical protein
MTTLTPMTTSTKIVHFGHNDDTDPNLHDTDPNLPNPPGPNPHQSSREVPPN